MSKGSAPVGIDFGTTNTLLYVYQGEAPRPVEIAGGIPNGPIPSVLGRSPKGGLREFLAGLLSWTRRRGGNDVKIFRRFKLDLPNTGLDPRQRDKHESFLNARDFLKHVFSEFKERSGFSEIDSLAFSVPESWVRGADQIGIEAIRQLSNRLHLPEPTIVSEPVAAACFFAHRYKLTKNVSFDGYALVYDHGGGTLDYSLVQIKGSRVTTIDGDGYGRNSDTEGFGGEFFDLAVFDTVAARDERVKALDAPGNEQDKTTWLRQFEELKRHAQIPFRDSYRMYIRGNESVLNELLFSVEVGAAYYDVYVEDLITTFREKFQPAIEKSLKRFADHCNADQPTLVFRDPQRFRVLMVGGFSEFYPIRELVHSMFNREYGCPRDVFETHFNIMDSWSATAQGACLVAAKKVTVIQNCPYTFGIISFNKDGEKVPNPLMQRGAALEDYARPKYLDLTFKLFDLSRIDDGLVRFYIERAGERTEMHGRRAFSEILPDFGKAAETNEWQFGCKCENGLITVFIRNSATSRIRNMRVGRFFEVMERGIDDGDVSDGSDD